MSVADLTHVDEQGASRMVDVSAKPITLRVARATGEMRMAAATLERIRCGGVAKGDVLAVARLAGIMGAKRTAELIPLCHPLALEAVRVDFSFVDDQTLRAEAQVQVTGRTGVEMEAMTAVSIALLAVYDMCKSVDRAMVVSGIRLVEKMGGSSGHFQR
ncbi:MAG: cyclic pyranopterin monophosphate synthase MoaC [Pirellulaceae bacterium]|jgi:cyclic pyranopterin phosphate synthase|nr:cyclic pyranopterin monophosphate synthase MoaC [Pirellulaceae bacterium]